MTPTPTGVAGGALRDVLGDVLRDVRLVALDVDGTLLDVDGTLPGDRRDAVAALSASGLPVLLATGKLWSSIRALADALALTGPHVTCNGAAVVDADGRPLHLETLDGAVADAVAAELRGRGVPYAVYLADGSLVTDRVRPEHDVLALLGEPMPTVGAREGRRVLKVLSIVASEDEGDLRDLAADRARVQRTGHRFLEWNAPTADKATGLAHVVAALGLTMQDVAAVGDAENDVTMLRAVGLGVAVASASPAAVAAADVHLTSDVSGFLGDLLAGAVRR